MTRINRRVGMQIYDTDYSDGTTVEYDRKNHSMNINVKGDIVIEASGSITIKAKGNVRVNGSRIDLN